MGRHRKYVSKTQIRDKNRDKSKRYYHNHKDDILKKKREESTLESDTKKWSKEEFTVVLKEIIQSYKECKTYSTEVLYEDRLNWLRGQIENDWLNMDKEYDFDTNIHSIGWMIAQLEEFEGIVIETDKGIFPKKEIMNES